MCEALGSSAGACAARPSATKQGSRSMSRAACASCAMSPQIPTRTSGPVSRSAFDALPVAAALLDAHARCSWPISVAKVSRGDRRAGHRAVARPPTARRPLSSGSTGDAHANAGVAAPTGARRRLPARRVEPSCGHARGSAQRLALASPDSVSSPCAPADSPIAARHAVLRGR